MTNEEKQQIRDFLDGLPTGSIVELGVYDPACMDLDLGYVENNPGVYIRAVVIEKEPYAVWHAGAKVVSCNDPNLAIISIENQCRRRSWIESVVVPGRRQPGMKG